MHKKILIKNRPLDVTDVTEWQNWTEDALKTTMKTIYTSGIVTGLNITARSAMTVNLNTGYAFDTNFDYINVTTQQVVTIAAANATNPRKDLIAIKFKRLVEDNIDTGNIYGNGTSYLYSQDNLDSFEIVVITGTPAASPIVPSTPAGCLALANIHVAANTTSIITSNITDVRTILTINQNINVPDVIIGKSQPTNTNILWIDMN